MQEPKSTATVYPTAPAPKPKQTPPTEAVTSYGQKPAVFGDVSGLTIDHVNQVVDQVDQAHKRLFGTKANPSLVYDVTRGVSQGIVKTPDINHLFDVPLSPQAGAVRRTAREVQANTPGTISATDPGAAAAIVKAQGHPLTPQQKEQLGVTQGTETYAKARQHLVTAGILPKLQIVHDEKDFLTQLTGGAFLFATGLMTAAPILAISGGYSAYKDAKNIPLGSFGLHDPFGVRPEKVAPHLAAFGKGTAVGLVQKTFNDVRAVSTGNMEYLRANPDAYYNVFFLGLGGVGALTKLSSAAAIVRSDGLAAAGRHLAVPPPPPRKVMTLGNHQVEALNFDNPVVRWADNLRTDRMKARSMAGKEPVPAAVLRALHVPYASDFISKTFSYEAKIRREGEAFNRSKYMAQTHLVRQLDTITSAAVDATSYLEDVPKISKNQLSLGEMKALHVIAMGGDPLEALRTMREAHETWRDYARVAGSKAIAKDHESQLVALKLADRVLRDHDAGITSKAFEKTLPIFREAAEQATTIKIDSLGLSPESSDMRDNMEYDIYKRQRVLPNRKKVAALVKGAETRVATLERKKGFVPPELTLARDEAKGILDEGASGATMSLEDLKKVAQYDVPKYPQQHALAKDLAENGFKNPVELTRAEDGSLSVSDGNHRVSAADLAGINDIPVVIRDAKAVKALQKAERRIAKYQEQDHPDLAAARKRLESLKLTMQMAEDRISNAEHREGAFRVPVFSRDRAITGSVSNVPPPRRANQFGEYLPASPAEITHSFTGKALIAGDIRLDFTNMMARNLAKTVRAAMWVDDYNAKLRASVDVMPEGNTGRFFAPLRKSANISDRIREIANNIHEPGITTEDFESITHKEVEELNQRAYAKYDHERQVWVEQDTGKPINAKDYAWYDSRAFTPDRGFRTEASGLKSAFNTVYNWVGRPRIFLAPRYILNLPSNYAMNALHEGIMTPQALAASYFGRHIYDEETLRRIDERMGFSRSKSLGPTRTPKTPPGKLMNEIVQGWHWVTDVHPRRAAFLYEAWRKGYSSAEDIAGLMKDPAHAQDLSEISRRAEKSMVELSNMTWAEQEWIRHIMFVYPWRSRQALWSLRTLAEHPAHSAILAEIGENAIQGEEQNKPLWIQAAIKKYLQLGYVITGWNPDGSPKGVQAGMLNTFSGLSDVMGFSGVTALAGGSFSFDSADPGLQVFIEAIKGQDNFGRDLPGKGSPKQWLSAFLDVAVYQTPIALAFKRGGKFAAEKPIPAFNPAQRGSLLAQINAGQRRVAMSPGWLNGYGMLFSGSATPRSIDKYKMLYDYYHSLSTEEQYKYEGNLVNRVLNVQSQLLQRAIPEGVHKAIAVTREFQYRQQQYSKDHGMTGGVPDMQKDQLLLDTLKSRGLISGDEAAKEMKKIESIPGLEQKDHTQARTAWMIKYAQAGELHQWDSDMRRLVTFTPDGFKAKVARMRDLGFRVPEPPASQQNLEELGRRTLAFEDKVRKVTKEISSEPDKVRKAGLRSQLTDLLAEADQPTVIGGNSFPSVSRLSFADLSEQDRRQHIISIATNKWTTLSSLDRELLAGNSQSPTVDRIWAAIDEQMAHERSTLKPGQSLPPGLKNYYIQGAAKSYPEFKTALKIAGQPLADRLATYQVIKKSPVKDYWNVLLSTASQFAQDKIKSGWVKQSGKPDWSAIQNEWVRSAPQIAQWVASQKSDEFKREYREFTNSDHNFYAKLVKP